MKRKTLVFVCLLVIALMVASTVPVGAKKPPPKTTPEGTLYIQYPDSDINWVWSMDTDGTNMAKEHSYKGEYFSMSRSQHGGDWWYVGWKAVGGSYPDGEPRWELFAESDDGQTKQLTDDANMEVNRLGIKPVWGLDDDTVTWSYYDEDDDVYYPDIWGYDWNLAGDKIAFQRHDGYLYFDSVPTGGSPTQLVKGYLPKLSPDGTKVAFGRYLEILVIDVDGTDETSLVKVKTNKGTFKGVQGYEWSPDGKYVVYTKWEVGRATWNWKATMYTIKPDGSGSSSISGLSVSDWKNSRDWR